MQEERTFQCLLQIQQEQPTAWSYTPSRGPRHQHEVEQDDNGDDWTFSLNQDEVVIKFTDSVTKVKGSKDVMFDEIELSRVLVDLKV